MKVFISIFIGLIEQVLAVISPLILADAAMTGSCHHPLLVRGQVFYPDVCHALL